MHLIKCEVDLILAWSKNWVITDTTTRASGAQGNPWAINAPIRATFFITNVKLYVSVVTL